VDNQNCPQVPFVILIDLEPMKYQSVYNRLRRIEGQVRGVEEMVAKEKAERDILIQLEAMKSSLASTISSFLAEIVEKNKTTEGSFLVDEDWLKSILRLIKKN